MAREIVSTTGMSVAEGTFWFCAVLCSCGILYPAYRARKHKLDRTTRTKVTGK